jgi:hypothetical protein
LLPATDSSVAAQIVTVRGEIAKVADDSLSNDAKILKQLFTQVELQYLSLRKELLLSEIERLSDKMAEDVNQNDWVLQDRLRRLQHQYDEVDKALQDMLLGRHGTPLKD